MTDYIRSRKRVRSVPSHKFAVGLHVTYRGSGPYRVISRLPDEGQGLQYRIRSDQGGQERVVIETDLKHTPEALFFSRAL
jgi:hypothetical protein